MKGIKYCIAALVLVAISTHAQQPAPLTDQQKFYGLSLFWKEAAYNFAYFDKQPNLNWDEEYQKFIPKVLASKSTFEYYRVLEQFSALLKDGHTDITLPSILYKTAISSPPIGLIEASHQAIVRGVEKSIEDKIPLGSRIISIDGIPLENYLKESVFPFISVSSPHVLWSEGIKRALMGKPDSSVKIGFEKPSGAQETLTLKRNSHKMHNTNFSYLPLPWGKFKLFEHQSLGNGIAYIALNSFGNKKIIEEFNQAYPEIKKARALIIDLRFNQGGDTSVATEILSNFTNNDLLAQAQRTRQHIATYKAWGRSQLGEDLVSAPDYRKFAEDNAWLTLDSRESMLVAAKRNTLIVPTIVLTSRDTASAAEDFLIFASQLPHFLTMGENTNGSTGQPIHYDLPGGGSFRICTKRDTYPDGREFVGTGIIPSIPVALTPDIIRSGKDTVLDLAIAELEKAK